MHIPVLLNEVIDCLDLSEGMIVLDATIGSGGHSVGIARKIGASGTIIGIDADSRALEAAKSALAGEMCAVRLIEGNFRDIGRLIDNASVDRVLFDLGLRSEQIELSGRGFSFNRAEPLIMTFEHDVAPGRLTARDVVNKFDVRSLARIFREYSDERYANRIARAIAESRSRAPIEDSLSLAEIVRSAVPWGWKKTRIHPATKVFQAIRMAVNDELESLRLGLSGAWNILSAGGRCAVISFHGGEDRIVKIFFRERAQEKSAVLISKKPIVPSEEEKNKNSRSRSAKLRVAEKIR